ncbi:uncharacterized protein LOC117378304 isoform X3 [Periophthalmus magnuspinnatus]|uniref:uncharacterized protein LOC117378304 isoform X3 n=1 Tax=Periophthalmus magnuspinnatus TaxID=409849 RepID=UPI00243634AE|nr:uncharacterized protein LOC117378304 isoform X3 [Periophthalmus magnuspinnatus]XP_055079916.1 uncharacterized protein LOC117378304 isoform X3 [Periophthalmus magnuspinnatus]
MALRRTRGMTSVASAVSIAEQLQHDCSSLLELYRKRESFSSSMTVTDGRLVPVQLSSALLGSQEKLWLLHSALVQCQGLMDKAVTKEEEELSSGAMGEYEKQRKMVQDRLSFLIGKTEELLKSQFGSTLKPFSVAPEVQCPSILFELKLWVYRVFKEIDYWAKMSISTMQALNREPTVVRRVRRSTRSRR